MDNIFQKKETSYIVGKDENYPTGGCVAISEESMVTVLKTVTPGTAVTIY